MTTQVVLPIQDSVFERVAAAVRLGLTSRPKSLPPWLLYDEAGSRLFEQITELPEYYLTRTERSIFFDQATDILTEACDGHRVRIVELGAGSASKTRILLLAALRRQPSVVYEPVDVSASALEDARACIESEIPEVQVVPRVMDYTNGFELRPIGERERRLVLYIGSSIGNFEPGEAASLLRHVRTRLRQGDAILVGVDLRKQEEMLHAAYNDAAGVTAAFNLNLLTRLNRELGSDFDLEQFTHRAIWNEDASRIEMHLISEADQTVHIDALDLDIRFRKDETIHTENSYKYRPGAPEAMLAGAGFTPVSTWTDPQQWFAVCLGRAE